MDSWHLAVPKSEVHERAVTGVMMVGARQDSANVVAAHVSWRHAAAKTGVADNYLECPPQPPLALRERHNTEATR
jgi:hypothetical protein